MLTLPEGWFWHLRQATQKEWFPGHWEATIYRQRHHWFPKSVATGSGWTEAEAINNCTDRLDDKDWALIREANSR